jgi:hypothetical protein
MIKASGYSGTPLAKKLGIKPGFNILLINQPDYYLNLFTDLPKDISINKNTSAKKNFIHYFARNVKELVKDIPLLRDKIVSDGMIWVSWYKKSSKIPTDVTEDIIRDIALKNKLVDVKVCAIDETWSALKLVIRIKDR